jgi:hypothetical protein
VRAITIAALALALGAACAPANVVPDAPDHPARAVAEPGPSPPQSMTLMPNHDGETEPAETPEPAKPEKPDGGHDHH